MIAMSPKSKAKKLADLAEEVTQLTASPLYTFRQENKYHPVFGEGDPDAELLFIGEAPGEQEAKKGRPFVGASGRILNELLDSIALEREDVYITSVLKDRPPKNRDPQQQEIELYAPFLAQQIEIIQPKVIAPLGRFAMEFVLAHFGLDKVKQLISKVHGHAFTTKAAYGDVTIVPLYHPAVALYNRDQRKTLEDDFQVLRRFL
jgi:DNA polymerase